MLNIKQKAAKYQLLQVFRSDSISESNPGLLTMRQSL